MGDELADHLDRVRSIPFLFVGSGLSRRYLGLDDWNGLLRDFTAKIGVNFQRLLGSVNGDLPALGAALSELFYDHWWEHEEYAQQREDFGHSITHREMPLKVAISSHMRERSADFDLFDGSYDAEIEALRSVTVDGVITTNWDLMLEQVFPGFKPFIGQEELLFGSSQGLGEIYKIHGCCSRPDSLVLTTEDYDVFQTRNPYLSARLLSVFVDHPIVFLGYRLGDPNIQSILSSIVNCLTAKNLLKLQDRLIFVERANGTPAAISRQDQHFGPLRNRV